VRELPVCEPQDICAARRIADTWSGVTITCSIVASCGGWFFWLISSIIVDDNYRLDVLVEVKHRGMACKWRLRSARPASLTHWPAWEG
jgi:hypothetical protein